MSKTAADVASDGVAGTGEKAAWPRRPGGAGGRPRRPGARAGYGLQPGWALNRSSRPRTAAGARLHPGRIVRIAFVTCCSLAWLVPTYLLVINALVPAKRYSGTPVWWPGSFGLIGNLHRAWDSVSLGPGFLNSLGYGAACAALAVLVAAAASFAVVVIPTRRPALWFWFVFAGTIFPFQMYLGPLFSTYNSTGLYDTRFGLGLVYLALTIPFAFFVIRNQMTTVPRSLAEAAQLDGAPWRVIFLRIHLPLIRPALVAAFLFQFTWVWNDLLFGITLAHTPAVMPVMVALASLNESAGVIPQPVILTGALLVSVPTVVLFLVFQRVFSRGIGSASPAGRQSRRPVR